MFKNCKNLFDLSRKLGSVVTGLGLAGVLFSGQVSAAPPQKTAKWYNLAEQDEEFRRIYNPSRYNLDRSEAGRRGWVSRNSRRFTQHEDESLMRLVQEHGERKWVTIARLLDAGKSPRQCKVRYRHLLQHGDRVPLPIPQINTPLADSTPTPIIANGNQNAVNTTNTSNAATQSGQVLPGAGEH